MKRAWFKITSEALKLGIGMPKDCQIEHINWNFQESTLEVVVSDGEFEDIPEGSIMPRVFPTISTKFESVAVGKTWNWNLGLEKEQ